ncbi:3324_t:CDS:1 [Diversispora eburnea]|uniref:3324_t:CDS:1 n=1 Tax=Diversispora eburnea TaxID=1213867 RepID=A0A9N9FK76_9GLOM|nr:3324_t:CDS:1 [Diversispora eburnea]
MSQPTIKRVTSYLPSYWLINAPSEGIQVQPANEYLNYKVTNLSKANQWTNVSIQHLLPTNGGALIIFRIRVNKIEKTSEVKLTLPADIIWRFHSNNVNYQWFDSGGSFQTLSSSNIRPDGTWHTVTLALTPEAVVLLEDGNLKFNWSHCVARTVNPRFDMQILDIGGSLDIDIGDISVIPPRFI